MDLPWSIFEYFATLMADHWTFPPNFDFIGGILFVYYRFFDNKKP